MTAGNVPSARQFSGGSSKPTVLFFTDNGAGLGHLTRQLAVATRAEGRFQSVFLTMSLGYPLLRHAGIPCEYFPSYSLLGLSKSDWSHHLRARLAEMLEATAAKVVVVDHVSPPASFGELRRQMAHVRFVWARRGLWREGANRGSLRLSADFDVVVEPGDIAAPIDVGATAEKRSGVVPIDPIVLTEPGAYLPREMAREELGLSAEGRAVLLQVGDSSPKRLRSLLAHLRDVVAEVAGDNPIHLFAPLHPLHGSDWREVPGITMSRVYPIARYYRAFDAIVSNSGYNSFHEVVLSGIPALFVSRESRIDDQARRGRFAALCGRAHWLPTFEDERLKEIVSRLLSPGEALVASATAEKLGSMAGARQLADILSEMANSPAPTAVEGSAVAGSPQGALPPIPSLGGGLPSQSSGPILVIALEHSEREIAALASDITSLRESHTPRATIVLATAAAAPQVLSQARVIFEGVMPEKEWSQVRPGRDYRDFLHNRVEGLKQRYGPSLTLTLKPGDRVSEWVDEYIRSSDANSTPSEIGRDPAG